MRLLLPLLLLSGTLLAQSQPAGSTTPKNPVPDGPPKADEITKVLVRVHDYLVTQTSTRLIDRTTGAEITDTATPNPNAVLDRGAFNFTTYEWGLVYAGMLAASEATGDARFKSYVDTRLRFIAERAPAYRAISDPTKTPFAGILQPRTLPECGPLCMAMIKATRAGVGGELRPWIDRYVAAIEARTERLADGTFARNQPQPQSVWSDDLYMGVPALARMGELTGEKRYFDEAVKQVTKFAARMFNRETRLWMHGWVEGMEPHPELRWARGNGWATLALVEVLDALPANHAGRGTVLEFFRANMRGLADVQAKDGRWHQLLDRPDSYPETSATAIFTYCIARGVNRGWLDARTFAPKAMLGWQALATQVNAQGQVENVCVGTGMGFEPAFYLTRPVSSVAPHGPGTFLVAGAEMIVLVRKTETASK
jgi:unsaturated rhamnogalacturonyl hydrolase